MAFEATRQSSDLVKKIWNLCHILRGDGVSYHEYISELTYLLFLKIAEETGTESTLPSGYRWCDLVGYKGEDLLTYYRDMLTYLGGHAASPIVREIYAFPTTVFSHSENLKAVITGIAKLDWDFLTADSMGDIYEGLLSRNSQDARSGAGQYFTPRALVDCMVSLLKPRASETIQDPSCGTGGFLIAANQYISESREDTESKKPAFEGVEIEKATYRICQMNSFLHGLGAKVILGDALTSDAASLRPANVILANPPFGTKTGSARPLRADLPYRTSNKQLAFLQHIWLGLKNGGRAAVVVPDNVLFEEGVGKLIRSELMRVCDLHTVLRLPNGIFYSQGVNTNVLFFTRRDKEKDNSAHIWFYDMRSSMPRFGKNTPLTREYFHEFETLYGDDEFGHSSRREDPKFERWRCFSRSQIQERDDNLDITWLAHKAEESDLTDATPQEVASAVMFHLQAAMAEIELLTEDLSIEDEDL